MSTATAAPLPRSHAAPRAETPLPASASRPINRRNKLAAAVAALALSGLGTYYVLEHGIESTDDAQVDADVVAVPARVGGTVARVYFEDNAEVKAGALLAELDPAPFTARLAQAEAELQAAEASAIAADAAARYNGRGAEENRAMAKAGLSNTAESERASGAAIAEGEAQLSNAEAKLAQAELDAARAGSLAEAGAFSRTQRENAETALTVARTAVEAQRARLASLRAAAAQAKSRVAEASAKLRQADQVDTVTREAEARAGVAHAQVDTARARRDLAALELSYTRIVAPADGVVSKRAINAGQSLAAGQTVVQLVPPARWVTANFKETQLAHMRPGQPVELKVDAYPDVTLHGTVESFSAATGARFTLLPPDNASGNFTKVVQRVPVRIQLDAAPQGVALVPGLSVELDVNTNRG